MKLTKTQTHNYSIIFFFYQNNYSVIFFFWPKLQCYQLTCFGGFLNGRDLCDFNVIRCVCDLKRDSEGIFEFLSYFFVSSLGSSHVSRSLIMGVTGDALIGTIMRLISFYILIGTYDTFLNGTIWSRSVR